MCESGSRSGGGYFETLACKYLTGKGYSLLGRNVRFGHKEIDIIALDGDTVVFIEVKGRARRGFGLPGESVTEKKKARIIKVAEAYLARRKLWNKACRFDVICVSLVDNQHAEFLHIRNAFEA
jgi:putative endonuclease